MRDVLVVGSGNIGATIADLLGESGDYRVTVADRDTASLQRIHTSDRVATLQLDASVKAELAIALHGKFAVLSAAPFHITQYVAEAAHAAGVHYLDLTEDVACTRAVKELSATSRAALIRNAAWRPDLFRSSPTTLRRGSNVSTRCGCASVRCRCFRRMR